MDTVQVYPPPRPARAFGRHMVQQIIHWRMLEVLSEWAVELCCHWSKKSFSYEGKKNWGKKKKMFAAGAWISSFVSKDRKTPGPSRLSIEFYVPFQNRLILSWLARLHSVWCLTQFYLSSSNHTFYLFFNREKTTQNYYCSFPRSGCSSENSESLEQSKAHCNREHRSQGYNWPRPQTVQPCYPEWAWRLGIFAYPQRFCGNASSTQTLWIRTCIWTNFLEMHVREALLQSPSL